MIIGFLGKGGSGKSTLSSLFTQYLATRPDTAHVLAIDADHNMDLTYNLAPEWTGPYFGASLSVIKKYAGLTDNDLSSEAFFTTTPPAFSLSPTDSYTETYSRPIPDTHIRLMSAGPHTDAVLYDQSCSHALYAPLKIYLPHLRLSAHEHVVVDEKAGADGAGTGIASGFDCAVIVSEPTPHGVKAARHIAELLDFHGTPYIFVGNKIHDEQDAHFIRTELGADVICFTFNKNVSRYSDIPTILEHYAHEFAHIKKYGEQQPNTRLERSRNKFEKNTAFQQKVTGSLTT